MNHRPVCLSEFFREHHTARKPLALATIVHTIGSTYRKAGAQMLIGADGSAAGLLSGGCLEADLVERAREVIATGQAVIAEYDTRSSDDILWGIGLGCDGAMRILLTRLDGSNDYQPFGFVEDCRVAYRPGATAFVVASTNAAYPLGAAYTSDAADGAPASVRLTLTQSPRTTIMVDAENASFLVLPVELPLRLLLLGAGPDAMPLVEVAGLMGWNVTVLDHRPAYAVADRFPRAQHVELRAAGTLSAFLQNAHYDAAIVMSHHLTSDEAYLRALADSTIPYIGLLGPAPRRARLMADIGEKSQQFGNRLYGPVGLDIGARTPETIALAIVAEIQAVAAKRPGGSFRAEA